jgi:hypothetical protein
MALLEHKLLNWHRNAALHSAVSPNLCHGHFAQLLAIGDAPQILTPGRLLGVAQEKRPGDVLVMSEFATTQPGEIGFGAVGAGTVDAAAVLVIDPPLGEAGV